MMMRDADKSDVTMIKVMNVAMTGRRLCLHLAVLDIDGVRLCL
jgi:hypothetical protein